MEGRRSICIQVGVDFHNLQLCMQMTETSKRRPDLAVRIGPNQLNDKQVSVIILIDKIKS